MKKGVKSGCQAAAEDARGRQLEKARFDDYKHLELMNLLIAAQRHCPGAQLLSRDYPMPVLPYGTRE